MTDRLNPAIGDALRAAVYIYDLKHHISGVAAPSGNVSPPTGTEKKDEILETHIKGISRTAALLLRQYKADLAELVDIK